MRQVWTLAVSPSTILRMINDGVLPAQHLCNGAPWIIRLRDLQREDVREEARARRIATSAVWRSASEES